MKPNFKSSPKDPPKIRPGGATRNRVSDMRKRKRGSCVDFEMDNVPERASFRRHEVTRSPKSDEPKTSEFAYFRSVKNGAVRGHSRSLHNDDDKHLNCSKTHYRARATTNASDTLKSSIEDVGYSVPGERAGPSGHQFFLSPSFHKYDELNQPRTEDLNSLLRSENVTPSGKKLCFSPLNETSENSGNRCNEKGIFSAKRQRLCQWAHNSLSEIEKLHPKGFDLVSSLLSRLFPKDDGNDDWSKRETGNSCIFPTFDEYKNSGKELHLSQARDWDKELPKICSGRSSEIVISERDTYFSGFAFPNYGTKTHFPDELMDLQHSSKSHKSRSSHTKHDTSFCLPFERFGSSSSCLVEEMDELFSPIELTRKEPHGPFLEWDRERVNGRVRSSIISHDAAKNLSPALAVAWNTNHQQILYNALDTKALCSQSLFSNYCLEYNSIPNYLSTSSTQDFGPYLVDEKCAVEEPNQFSPPSPFTPKCITLTEDSKAKNILYGSNVLFSYRDHQWLKNKVGDSKPWVDFWWKCFQSADFSPAPEAPPSIFHAWQFPQIDNSVFSFPRLEEAPEWQFPQIDNSVFSFPRLEEAPEQSYPPFSEGTIINHSWPSNFQTSLDRLTNSPLLLDNANRDACDQEIYFDDDKELKYSLVPKVFTPY